MNDEVEMRLMKLKPVAPSPALKARIALQLGTVGTRSSLRWKFFGTTSGLAAALCIVALLSRQPWPSMRSVVVEDRLPNPTAWAYRRAYAESLEELERCLDRDAAKLLVWTNEDRRTAGYH